MRACRSLWTTFHTQTIRSLPGVWFLGGGKHAQLIEGDTQRLRHVTASQTRRGHVPPTCSDLFVTVRGG
jgi:hypothetical protein